MRGLFIAVGLLIAGTTHASAQTFYLGQILTLPFNFCPSGTLQTSGQLLAINTSTALFSLLGTTYGGNGTTTFALPNIKAPPTGNRGPVITCITTQGVFPNRS